MKLFEIHSIEYNGEHEYNNSHILAAKNIDEAWQIAREYFSQWYGGESTEYKMDNPNSFIYYDGSIGLEIISVDETTIKEWVQNQIISHSIGTLPVVD